MENFTGILNSQLVQLSHTSANLTCLKLDCYNFYEGNVLAIKDLIRHFPSLEEVSIHQFTHDAMDIIHLNRYTNNDMALYNDSKNTTVKRLNIHLGEIDQTDHYESDLINELKKSLAMLGWDISRVAKYQDFWLYKCSLCG